MATKPLGPKPAAVLPKPPAQELTVNDRCDQCGAQAWFKATLKTYTEDGTPGQLYFCAHHGREVHAAILPQCEHWLDESHYINKPSELDDN